MKKLFFDTLSVDKKTLQNQKDEIGSDYFPDVWSTIKGINIFICQNKNIPALYYNNDSMSRCAKSAPEHIVIEVTNPVN